MLSKKFKSNKFYEVTRYWFKYGNETDEIEATTTVWDSFEKAIAYIERYAVGLKFASAWVEEVIVDREITVDDYKHNNFEYVSTQKVYDVTDDCVEDFTKEEICYFKKSEQADETAVEEKSEPVNEVEQADEDEKRVSIKNILPNIYYGVYLDNIPMFYCKSLDEAKKARNFLLKDVRKHKSRDKPP